MLRYSFSARAACARKPCVAQGLFFAVRERVFANRDMLEILQQQVYALAIRACMLAHRLQ